MPGIVVYLRPGCDHCKITTDHFIKSVRSRQREYREINQDEFNVVDRSVSWILVCIVCRQDSVASVIDWMKHRLTPGEVNRVVFLSYGEEELDTDDADTHQYAEEMARSPWDLVVWPTELGKQSPSGMNPLLNHVLLAQLYHDIQNGGLPLFSR